MDKLFAIRRKKAIVRMWFESKEEREEAEQRAKGKDGSGKPASRVANGKRELRKLMGRKTKADRIREIEEEEKQRRLDAEKVSIRFSSSPAVRG